MAETVVCVGAVVRKAHRILLVRQSPGHPLENQWTIPWGQIDPGESPTSAVLREIEEEAGITAHIDGLLGIQELPEPWLGMIGILFLCTHVNGASTPDGKETDEARYFDAAQLGSIADSLEPLSAWLVHQAFAGELKSISRADSGPFDQVPTYL